MLSVINPATDKVVAECPRADILVLNAAVATAKAAFPAWSALTLLQRREKLTACANDIMANAAEIAQLITSEQGKPLAHAHGEVEGSVYMMHAMASLNLADKVVASTPARFA